MQRQDLCRKFAGINICKNMHIMINLKNIKLIITFVENEQQLINERKFFKLENIFLFLILR